MFFIKRTNTFRHQSQDFVTVLRIKIDNLITHQMLSVEFCCQVSLLLRRMKSSTRNRVPSSTDASLYSVAALKKENDSIEAQKHPSRIVSSCLMTRDQFSSVVSWRASSEVSFNTNILSEESDISFHVLLLKEHNVSLLAFYFLALSSDHRVSTVENTK